MLKVRIITSEYATCDKCRQAGKPDNPVFQLGSFLTGFIWLHKSCLDFVVATLNQMFDEWKRSNGK
jgi:hypothetical protein